MKFNRLACLQENGEMRSLIDVFMHKTRRQRLGELKIPEMQVSAKLRSSNRTIFVNKRHTDEKNGKIHAARPATVLYRHASEKIVLLLDCNRSRAVSSIVLTALERLF